MNKNVIILASKFTPKCTCLVQAMAFKLLSEKHLDTRLVIGIRNETKFESHAWVCLDDEVVFGHFENTKKFIELTSI